VPLRAKVIAALEQFPDRSGVLFPNAIGGRIDIDNRRSREWGPALKAAGVEHRRIYDMRHAFATWSVAAGMSVFTLSRRMGTSAQMIDATCGHLASDADEHDRRLLDAYDVAEDGLRGHAPGTADGVDERSESDAES
jgi:integrase